MNDFEVWDAVMPKDKYQRWAIWGFFGSLTVYLGFVQQTSGEISGQIIFSIFQFSLTAYLIPIWVKLSQNDITYAEDPLGVIQIRGDDLWVGKQPIKRSSIKRLVIDQADDIGWINMPWNLSNGEQIKGVNFPSSSIPQVKRFFHEKVSQDIEFFT